MLRLKTCTTTKKKIHIISVVKGFHGTNRRFFGVKRNWATTHVTGA